MTNFAHVFRNFNWPARRVLGLAVWGAVIALSLATAAAAGQVQLAWNASTSSGVTGYVVQWGLSSGAYTASSTTASTSCTVTGLAEGATYYFAVKAQSSTGQQSAASNQVSYKVPAVVNDTDGDGLTDADEAIYGTDPAKADTDGDGLSDYQEIATYKTDALKADTDGDALSDGQEVLTYKSDATKADTDGDGLSDGQEALTYKTSPIKADSDGDGTSDGQEVTAGTDPNDSASKPGSGGTPASLAYVAKTVTVTTSWQTVSFGRTFTAPVVVAGPLSLNDTAPAVVRIRNVTATGFEIRIQEWNYLDGTHAGEQVTCLAMEKGRFSLADGSQVEAGLIQASGGSFATKSFTKAFAKAPVVLTSVVSYKEADTVSERLRSIGTSSFQIMLSEQQRNRQSHAAEDVAYIAWQPGSGSLDDQSFVAGLTGNAVSDKLGAVAVGGGFIQTPLILASMQTTVSSDPCALRQGTASPNSVDLMAQEEQSRDTETSHSAEVVGFVCLAATDDKGSEEPVATKAVYEDAEDGDTAGWSIYDSSPAGAKIANVTDSSHGRVIALTSSGTDNGFRLNKADGSLWNNTSQLVLSFDMKAPNLVFYVELSTTAGDRELVYWWSKTDNLGSGDTVHHGLSSSLFDNTWHTVTRDLAADLADAQPGVTITAVKEFLVRGNCSLDNITLSN